VKSPDHQLRCALLDVRTRFPQFLRIVVIACEFNRRRVSLESDTFVDGYTSAARENSTKFDSCSQRVRTVSKRPSQKHTTQNLTNRDESVLSAIACGC
jgi:DNA-binding NarL/FixJ family response regulator